MEEEDDPVKKRNKGADNSYEETDEATPGSKKPKPLPTENGVLKKILNKNKDFLSSDEDVAFSAVKRIKLFSDDSSVDTAETIKKIQAFIALGKSDDSKKDSESPGKQVISKPSSKNILGSNENLDESCDDLVSNITELQRTLQGLDDSQDYSDHIIGGKDSKSLRKELSLASLKENNANKSSELNLGNDVHTPSRVSKRIQSKSVKFSAKKMLRGDDTTVLKRMIPGYEKEKKFRKDKIPTKVNKGELRKIQILGTTLPPDEEVSSEAESIKPETLPEGISNNDKAVSTANTLNVSSNITCNSPKPNLNSQTFSPSSPEQTNSSASPDNKERLTSLVDQLDKFAVTNGKITLELKTAQQKKVVRIAVPPKASSPLVKTSLGPDIVIKRVKPVKKPIVPTENVKETSKISEKNLERKIQDVPHHLIQISPRLDIEKLPVKKFKEDIVKIQKNIIKSGKTDEIKSSVMSVKYVNLQKPLNESIIDSKPVMLNEDIGPSKTDGSKGEVSNDEPSLTKQIAEALENTPTLKTLREESALKRIPEKSTRGRKPSKNNFWSNKFKGEKKPGKSKREDIERSPSVSDIEDLPGEAEEKREFQTLFDRYFITSERYVEHHDSLDSDSSTDFDSEVYTHFINLKHHKSDKKQEATVYDLMHDISIELPTWNIHAASNGEMFYLVQIDGSDDKPLMKKVVELDLENNAKVYIDDKLVPRYEGNYSSYEDIRQLIYDIDQL